MKSNLRYGSVLLLFLTVCLPADASKKVVDWQQGKLLSFGMSHWVSTSEVQTNGHVDSSGNFTSTVSESDWGHNTYRVILDDGKVLYFAERTLSFRWQHDPIFTENEMVNYAIDKSKLTIVDDTGKDFKMQIIKRRIKE